MITLLRRPYLLWGAYLAALAVIALAVKAIWPQLTSGAEGLSVAQLAVQAVITLLPLPVAALLGWRAIGFVKPTRLYLVVFPAATVAVGYLGGLDTTSWSTVVLAVALVCLVAFGEELAFRGVLLRLLLPGGVGRAVLISSVLFGLTHTVNLLLSAPPGGVLLQVAFAGMGAAGYAALAFRTGSLWPSICLHASYDLAFRIMDLEPGSWHANLYYTLHGPGGIVFALILLRRNHPRSWLTPPQLRGTRSATLPN